VSTVFLNGRFVEDADAKVSIFDGGFLHGAGLFETMRAECGRVFRLEAHLARLSHSAAKLLRPIEREALPSSAVLNELLERNALRQARVRLTLTAGSMLEVVEPGSPEMTVCVTSAPLAQYPPAMYEQGITVVICQYRQSATDPTVGHKTTAYLPRLLGLREAQAARCLEALWFTHQNYLAEGSISNVFLVKDGILRTPPLETPILPGLVRAAVLDLAAERGIAAQQQALSINDLLDADEVFLTNSVMQVMPVVRVEKHDIAGARVGPLTRKMLEAYRDLVQQECSAP
jgi:branched-chain amino acid aminotransferase